ncbi:tetratricopeptide repeat protein [Salibaculum griseiflavum]|jgi:Flp pilus assembly protein TadD|uniref:Tetratricopeptide repeat protein n=1 Tax=Salibaculum griseiflavum TaxID=1914409 RepID=A0A2V1P7U5_9RHOB|nr:tetratricopeptide repeat protein [Salibaculum griseiflavum]PWG17878.1 tetratricopeptide repeat protein [Salibaculum griseiflavum]
MTRRALWIIALFCALAACGPRGFTPTGERVFAPGVAGEADVDGLTVGHRLMAAGEFELALQAYTRAAGRQGLNVDTLSALGSANLRLGRLNQAEDLLRRAVEEDASFVPAWNNLGVILMERGEIAEAAQIFRRAYATDNGDSDLIRDNLRLALAKLENPGYSVVQENEQFQLVRRGTGDYLLLGEP